MDHHDAKNRELAELLLALDECKPVIPDEVARHLLEKVGFTCNDDRVMRLLALASQKFISDIVTDAFEYARTRTNAQNSKSGASKADKSKTVLTMEDLSAALAEYGINASRAPYYL